MAGQGRIMKKRRVIALLLALVILSGTITYAASPAGAPAGDAALLSATGPGAEPLSAEGGAHRLGPGQVVFTPIASLAADSEMVFSIRARAEQPGNHVFRAEMHCKPLDSRLVREETTHFYQDGSVMAGGSDAGGMNTADRRAAASEGIPSPLPAYRQPQPRR